MLLQFQAAEAIFTTLILYDGRSMYASWLQSQTGITSLSDATADQSPGGGLNGVKLQSQTGLTSLSDDSACCGNVGNP